MLVLPGLYLIKPQKNNLLRNKLIIIFTSLVYVIDLLTLLYPTPIQDNNICVSHPVIVSSLSSFAKLCTLKTTPKKSRRCRKNWILEIENKSL